MLSDKPASRDNVIDCWKSLARCDPSADSSVVSLKSVD